MNHSHAVRANRLLARNHASPFPHNLHRLERARFKRYSRSLSFYSTTCANTYKMRPRLRWQTQQLLFPLPGSISTVGLRR